MRITHQEGTRHDTREFVMVKLAEAGRVEIEEIMDGLSVEALLHLGVGREQCVGHEHAEEEQLGRVGHPARRGLQV